MADLPPVVEEPAALAELVERARRGPDGCWTVTGKAEVDRSGVLLQRVKFVARVDQLGWVEFRLLDDHAQWTPTAEARRAVRQFAPAAGCARAPIAPGTFSPLSPEWVCPRPLESSLGDGVVTYTDAEGKLHYLVREQASARVTGELVATFAEGTLRLLEGKSKRPRTRSEVAFSEDGLLERQRWSEPGLTVAVDYESWTPCDGSELPGSPWDSRAKDDVWMISD